MKHSPPNPFLPGRALVLAVLPLVAVTPVTWAGDYYFNPANGVYGSNSDWRVWNGSTWVVPSTPPGTSDNAYFGWLNSSQTLGFSVNYNVGAVDVLTGSATFNLNSHTWNVTNGFYVGDGYSATANVSGGTVNTGSLLLGYSEGNAGVNGVFNLANATFNTSTSNYTVIGYDAGGTANINSGGVLGSGAAVYVGFNAGSNGTLNINSGGTVVADYIGKGSGTGTLNFNGGTLRARSGDYANFFYGFATGDVQIQSGGAIIDSNGFNIATSTGLRGSGSLTKQGSGTLTLTGASSYNGNTFVDGGTLKISSGGTVSSAAGRVGRNSGSSGAVTVDGNGSQWTHSSDLYVGGSGSGTLTIQNGGTVTDTNGYVAALTGSTGLATVTGAGSQWSNSGFLSVGDGGSGTFNIQNGGKVTNTDAYIGNNNTGTATVTGSGSQWNSSGALYVGRAGNGTLNVQNGGVVSNSSSGVISNNSSSTSAATVTGAGSQWDNSAQLYVGYGGDGTLTVDTGGKVTAAWVEMAYTAGGKGTLNLNGTSGSRGVLQTSEIYEDSGSGGGQVNFNGGILRATESNSTFLVGFETGDVQIQSGGAFIDSNGYNVTIGTALQGSGGQTKQGAGTLTLSTSNSYSGQTTIEAGTLVVPTGGSINHASANMNVGSSSGGNAALNITGGSVANGFGRIDSGGVATVSGGTWTNANGLFVGFAGSGSLNLTGGGNVTVGNGNGTVDIAFNPGSTGTLNLGAGGTAGTLSVARVNGGSGTATVNFNHSGSYTFTPQLTGTMTVNKLGSGTLTLNGSNSYTGDTSINAGTLKAGVANAIPSGSGKGSVVLDGGVSAAGTFDLNGLNASINGLSGSSNTVLGKVVNNATGTNTKLSLGNNNATANFAGVISDHTTGTGTVSVEKVGTGTQTLSGTNTYTGATTVNQGRLVVNGNISTSITTVNSGGTLGGSGIVGAVSVMSGGTIAAGNSIESLATGNLTLSGGSTFAYEMNNDAAAGAAGDLTAVNGTLDLSLLNDANLSLAELGSGSWSLGEKLTLISYSGAWNGGLFQLGGGTLADDSTFAFSGMDWRFNYNDTTPGSNWLGDLTSPSYVTMTAVPEPGSLLLIGCSSFALLRRRRIPNH